MIHSILQIFGGSQDDMLTDLEQVCRNMLKIVQLLVQRELKMPYLINNIF